MKSRTLSLAACGFALLFAAQIWAQPAAGSATAAAELLKKNDLAAAEAMLTPLTAAESTDAAAFFQLGSLRLRQQRAADAAAAYAKATQLDATKAEYFSQYAIALSLQMQGAPMMTQASLAPKMKKAFEKAVALDPNHLTGLIGLARFYSNAPEIAGGSLEKAAEFAARIQKMNPFLGAMELGLIAERGEDFAGALAQYDAASALQPDHAGAHAAAGNMLAKLDRKDEARKRLQRALELDPKREATRTALAQLDAPAP